MSGVTSKMSLLGVSTMLPLLGRCVRPSPIAGSARENLCDTPLFTGYTRDGGFATHLTIADARSRFRSNRKSHGSCRAPLCASR